MKEKLIIIGGGPAGLAAAIYAARAEIFPLVIAGAPAGGQLMLTSDVENFPGFDSILGPELVGKMRAQAEKFQTKFRDDNVKSIVSTKNGQVITLSDGEQLESETLLIATGASALWLGLPNEQRLRGRGVS
ncbi:MAG: FAD-dependent oxidoreductase, partial [Microgenomates group bacterium]